MPQKGAQQQLQLGGGDDGTPSRLGKGNGCSSSVSSLCFVSSRLLNNPLETQVRIGGTHDSSEEEDCNSDEDSVASLHLRSNQLLREETRGLRDARSSAINAAAALALSGRYLASSQINGDCFLWDLGRRTRVQSFAPNRGQGLLLRRCEDTAEDSKIIYQTRNSNGTVSLHDMVAIDEGGVKSIASVDTNSETFCVASPCQGNANLVALPSQVETVATVHDWRTDSRSGPSVVVHCGGSSSPLDEYSGITKLGMLTSVALVQEPSSSLVLACGMENGSLFFHDLRMIRQGVFKVSSDHDTALANLCSIALSKDPILSLDLAISRQSSPASNNVEASIVAIAGMAGDAAMQSDLSYADRGTVAVVKSTLDTSSTTFVRTARLRARVATCNVDAPTLAGKPGVSICRFRPDARIFAVGGWDYRLRIFDRAGLADPLVILRGHEASVHGMDWSSDADSSGLLATGGADGLIHIWRCLSNNSTLGRETTLSNSRTSLF
jgi:WD40 repeat protein